MVLQPEPTYDRRPSMFIASSSEALSIARAVKGALEDQFDVDIWDENAFELNQSTLDNLLNLSGFYDFAVAVFTKDDEARIREVAVHVTRDNVIFEFGLFLGRLGPHRVFLLAENGVHIMSDWAGITIATFARRSNLRAAVGTACDQLRTQMKRVERMRTFTLLPSTALAIGYYTNFLSRVLAAFKQVNRYRIVQRDARGNEIEGTANEYDAAEVRPVIHVELPARLRDLEPAALRRHTANYRQIELGTALRAYPFYVRVEEMDPTDGTLDLFDIPTTMLSSKRAIEEIFSDSFLADEANLAMLEGREIANFEKTLRLLIDNKAETEFFRFHVWNNED